MYSSGKLASEQARSCICRTTIYVQQPEIRNNTNILAGYLHILPCQCGTCGQYGRVWKKLSHRRQKLGMGRAVWLKFDNFNCPGKIIKKNLHGKIREFEYYLNFTLKYHEKIREFHKNIREKSGNLFSKQKNTDKQN